MPRGKTFILTLVWNCWLHVWVDCLALFGPTSPRVGLARLERFESLQDAKTAEIRPAPGEAGVVVLRVLDGSTAIASAASIRRGGRMRGVSLLPGVCQPAARRM